jgi:predicted unusual protein kinase regulating ubiquinone biosynthesis (AarF/ABC1/UbiB family)
MRLALLIPLILVGLGLLAAGWLAVARRRVNHAGIQTRRRGAVIVGFVGRNLVRHLWLRIRMLVANRRRRHELTAQVHLKSAAEATALMGNMKGLFMKLGQIVSFAHEGMPDEAKQQLRGLQKDAPPMSFALVRGVLEAELGGDLARTFSHVDEEPLAAASIGQVHRAVLRDGTKVAIKVQYPGVDLAIEGDLAMLGRMGSFAGVVSGAVDFPAVLGELRARITDELDYRLEARNQELFRRLWEGHPFIRVPRAYAAHTTKRVLVSEFVRGFGFYDFVAAANAREKRIASAVIADFVFDSMFCHLVYNGDPHPGNYLFAEDGSVTFLDFGCVKRFEITSMRNIKRFFRAVLEGDRATHDEYVVILGLVKVERGWDRDKMWAFWRYQLEPYYSGAFTFSPEYLARARVIMSRDYLKDMNLPPDLLFFTRITFGLNAIAQQLGAAGNFDKSVRRQFYDGDGPSALGLLDIAIPERFARLPIDVAPGAEVVRLEAEGELPFARG